MRAHTARDKSEGRTASSRLTPGVPRITEFPLAMKAQKATRRVATRAANRDLMIASSPREDPLRRGAYGTHVRGNITVRCISGSWMRSFLQRYDRADHLAMHHEDDSRALLLIARNTSISLTTSIHFPIFPVLEL